MIIEHMEINEYVIIVCVVAYVFMRYMTRR